MRVLDFVETISLLSVFDPFNHTTVLYYSVCVHISDHYTKIYTVCNSPTGIAAY